MSTSVTATIRERVKSIETMPSIPTIFLPLLDLLNLPPERVKLDEVVKLVSYDNTIAAQCLRAASSPLFGLAKSPESIKGAVIALGLRKVETILLTCCLGNAFPTKNWPLDPTVFWRHSLGCAMVCRKFNEKLEAGDGDRAYMAGLLHDLGFMVNCIAFPGSLRLRRRTLLRNKSLWMTPSSLPWDLLTVRAVARWPKDGTSLTI